MAEVSDYFPGDLAGTLDRLMTWLVGRMNANVSPFAGNALAAPTSAAFVEGAADLQSGTFDALAQAPLPNIVLDPLAGLALDAQTGPDGFPINYSSEPLLSGNLLVNLLELSAAANIGGRVLNLGSGSPSAYRVDVFSKTDAFYYQGSSAIEANGTWGVAKVSAGTVIAALYPVSVAQPAAGAKFSALPASWTAHSNTGVGKKLSDYWVRVYSKTSTESLQEDNIPIIVQDATHARFGTSVAVAAGTPTAHVIYNDPLLGAVDLYSTLQKPAVYSDLPRGMEVPPGDPDYVDGGALTRSNFPAIQNRCSLYDAALSIICFSIAGLRDLAGRIVTRLNALQKLPGYLPATILEDAQDGSTARWTLASGAGTIANGFDSSEPPASSGGSNVIEFSATTAPATWHYAGSNLPDTADSIAQWKFSSGVDFAFTIGVTTSSGKVTSFIFASTGTAGYNASAKTITQILSLTQNVWQSETPDLSALLAQYVPGETLASIASFSVTLNAAGSLHLDNLSVGAPLPTGSLNFSYDVYNGQVDEATIRSGAVAWVCYAYGIYMERTGDFTRAALGLQAMLNFLFSMQSSASDLRNGLVTTGWGKYVDPGYQYVPGQILSVSVEHNLDCYFAFLKAASVLPTAAAALLKTADTTGLLSSTGTVVINNFGQVSSTGTLPSGPIAAGTVGIFFGLSLAGQDDGKGNFIGPGITSGTINYSTGGYSVVFGAGVANGAPTFSYAPASSGLTSNALVIPASLQNTASKSASVAMTIADQLIAMLYTAPSAAAWAGSKAYALGAQIQDTSGNQQKCIIAGTSGATAPWFSTTLGGTTTDGTVTWQMTGAAGGAGHFAQGILSSPVEIDVSESVGSNGTWAALFADAFVRDDIAAECLKFAYSKFPLQNQTIQLSSASASWNEAYQQPTPFSGFKLYNDSPGGYSGSPASISAEMTWGAIAAYLRLGDNAVLTDWFAANYSGGLTSFLAGIVASMKAMSSAAGDDGALSYSLADRPLPWEFSVRKSVAATAWFWLTATRNDILFSAFPIELGRRPYLKTPKGVEQSVNALEGTGSIGALELDVVDASGYATALVSGGKLEGRTATLKVGYPGMSSSDFVTLATQVVDSVETLADATGFALGCRDLKRYAKSKIFLFGDDAFPTSSQHPRTLVANPMDVALIVLQNELGLGQAGTDPSSWKLYDPSQWSAGGGSNPTLIQPNPLVDVATFLAYRNDILAGYVFEFTLDQPVDAKQFLEYEIFKALGGYWIVRANGQLSPRFFVPPYSLANLASLNERNITGLAGNVAREPIINQVTYRLDYDGNKFMTELLILSTASLEQFGLAGEQIIEAKGVRTVRGGVALANLVARRIFERYAGMDPVSGEARGGAAALSVATQLMTMTAETGDDVLVSYPTLPNLATGRRGVSNWLMEVIEKQPDYARGKLTYKLLDTGWMGSKQLSRVAPAGTPAWTQATSAQQSRYMFLSSSATKEYSDGTAGKTVF